MIQQLQNLQAAAGAIFEVNARSTVPVSFNNDSVATRSARGVALCDRSHWGRIRVSDEDRILAQPKYERFPATPTRTGLRQRYGDLHGAHY